MDIGNNVWHNDEGVLSNSDFGQALENNRLFIPSDRPLPGTTQSSLPLVTLGNKAFPSMNSIMHPNAGRNLDEPEAVLNYHQTRSWRIIGKIFAILTGRWKIFCWPIIADPNKAVLYTKAAIALHDYFQTTESSVYCPPGFINGEHRTQKVIQGSWRIDAPAPSGLQPLRQAEAIGTQVISRIKLLHYAILLILFYTYTRLSAMVRDQFRDYFNSSKGEVNWQYNHFWRTN